MTYSIVARDPETGEMGVATQSQAFAVGNSVPFALPGHGGGDVLPGAVRPLV